MSVRYKKTSRDGSSFLLLPHVVLESPAYRRVSVYARALLMDIAMQLKGSNNGWLLCSTTHMKPLGWTSQSTLHKSKTELLDVGLIFETVKGQRPNKPSRYAVTWLALDRLPGFDQGALESFVRSAYRKGDAAPPMPDPKPTREQLFEKWRPENKNASLSPPHGLENPSIGPPHGLEGARSSPPHGPMRAQNTPLSSPPHGQYLDKPSVLPVPTT
ncbi:hypothetical protein [Variovorax sp. JS1663]|uniref:hypothetical protein n=1 Tax=Variovorax sp. JS1663 TaxID=1851577 RepID=UPI000B347802|nr:hypothetical protein [Variovorax sp. JS1663]